MKNSISYLAILLFGIVMVSCKKELTGPEQNSFVNTAPKVVSPVLQLSANLVTLLQENENKEALSLSWQGFHTDGIANPDYRIEASNAGSRFTGWYQIGSTCKTNYTYSVKELNQQIRQLFISGLAEDVLIRIKLVKNDESAEYSYGASTQITTYQPMIQYTDANLIRIPGNFQKWNVGEAPAIVSPKNNGEYEGYISFKNSYPQFLMVKSAQTWDNLSTYYDIGVNKFGFGGRVFSLSQGEGVYKFNASTNTNTWTCTKIEGWEIAGSAVGDQGNGTQQMSLNYACNGWEITGDFKKGNFIFKTVNGGTLRFGHNAGSPIGLAEYGGSPMDILADGNYTIRLSLLSAGNYSYSIRRN
jgi:hypothetical protein